LGVRHGERGALGFWIDSFRFRFLEDDDEEDDGKFEFKIGIGSIYKDINAP